MNDRRCFADTNILVYLATDRSRAAKIRDILLQDVVINTQVMNELFNVLRRKFAFDWEDLNAFMALVEASMEIHDMTVSTHRRGRRLAERYGFAIYDAMIVAAALEAGCETLWSEDMQHGMSVENRLTIRNPFIA